MHKIIYNYIIYLPKKRHKTDVRVYLRGTAIGSMGIQNLAVFRSGIWDTYKMQTAIRNFNSEIYGQIWQSTKAILDFKGNTVIANI